MGSEPLTQEQKIAQAKAIGWQVRLCSSKEGYYLYTPEPDIYEPDDNEEEWLPVKTEADAWALLTDDPTEYWIQRLGRRRENHKAMAKEYLEELIAEANADYQKELAEIEVQYQDALAMIEQAGEGK